MDLQARLRRALAERGLLGGLLHVPRAAVRPLLLAVRTRLAEARAPRLVAAASPARLHLGSGSERLAGWINVDLRDPAELCLNLTRPLPLPDQSVDAIYSQHFIEHITKAQAGQLVRECARVLKPGGWFRCSTPDLAYYVRQWQERAAKGGDTAVDAADGLNDIIRLHEHLYVYDEAALCDLLARAGLIDIERARPQESRCEHLHGLDSRQAGAPPEVAAQNLILEARRP